MGIADWPWQSEVAKIVKMWGKRQCCLQAAALQAWKWYQYSYNLGHEIKASRATEKYWDRRICGMHIPLTNSDMRPALQKYGQKQLRWTIATSHSDERLRCRLSFYQQNCGTQIALVCFTTNSTGARSRLHVVDLTGAYIGWLYFLDKNYFLEESDCLNDKLPDKISS